MANPFIDSLKKSNGGGSSYSGSNPFIKSMQPTAKPTPAIIPQKTTPLAPDKLVKDAQSFFNTALQTGEKVAKNIADSVTHQDFNKKKIISPVGHTSENGKPVNIKINFTEPKQAPSAQLKDVKPQQQQPNKQPVKQQQGTTLSAAKPQTVWNHITDFFNAMTGNSPTDQVARAQNAYSVQKVAGEKLYQKKVQDYAKQNKIKPEVADQVIQAVAKENGQSKFDFVGLSLTELEKQGGNPFRNAPIEEITKELGIRNVPTNKEFTDLLMTGAVGLGLAEAPIATVKALGIFSGVNELKSGLISAIKGKGFQLGAGQSLSDLVPDDTNNSIKIGLDVIDFLGTSAVVGGIYKYSPKLGDKLTKDVITQYNIPKTIRIEPKTVKDVVIGKNTGIEKDLIASLGLTSDKWKKAAQNGITIDVPAEKIVRVVDKPYWAKLKNLIGKQASKPQEITYSNGKKQYNTIAGYLPAGEYAPHEARSAVMNSPLADTPEGRAVVKASIDAEQQGKNLTISNPEAETKILQDKIRKPETFRTPQEKKAFDTVYKNPLAVRDAYIEKFQNEVNPDKALSLIKEYKGHNAGEFSRIAGSVKEVVYDHLLQTEKGKKNNTVYITAGGSGSGKTTTVDKKVALKDSNAIVVDTTFSNNSAPKDIKKALDHGYKVKVSYVLRNPVSAWEQGVLPRVKKEGRVVSEGYFLESHQKAKENILKVYDKYVSNPDVSFLFIDNNGEKANVTDIDTVKNFTYNPHEVAHKIINATDQAYESRRITKQEYTALTADRARLGIAGVEKPASGKGRAKSKRQIHEEQLLKAGREHNEKIRIEAISTIKEAIYSGDIFAAEALHKDYIEFNGITDLPELDTLIEEVNTDQKKIISSIEKEIEAERKSGNPDDPTNKLLEIAAKIKTNNSLLVGKDRIIENGSGKFRLGGKVADVYDRLAFATDIDGFGKNIEILSKQINQVFTDIHDIIKSGGIDGADYERFKKQLDRYKEQARNNYRTRHRTSLQGGIEQEKPQVTEASDKAISSSPVNTLASRGASPIGSFEKVKDRKKQNDFKLFEESKKLVRKYAERIGEKYLPKKALGSYHLESHNIRTTGMNSFSVNTHEIAHAIDHKFDISTKIHKQVGTTEQGKPLYDPATKPLRKEMTQLYKKFYPGGKSGHPLRTRMVEGYATLVQKYVEMPSTISEEFPNLTRQFLQEGGDYYNPTVGEYIKDAQGVVAKYQGLDELDKIGARVVSKTMKTDKTFLNFFEKVRTFAEDEIYPVEKLGKIAGTIWSGDDPSLWLRQYSRGGGIYANNILDSGKGYWTLDSEGNTQKVLKFNWNTLVNTLQKNKTTDSFGYYLVARDQVFEWKELDEFKKKYEEVVATIENLGGLENAAGVMSGEGKSLIDEFKEARKEYKDQLQYLQKNGFLRSEVEGAYTGNKERFKKEEEMYDALVRGDLDLLHNPQVGIISTEKYDKLSAKEGYASMKRVFFDDILGEAKDQYTGAGGKLAPKISSLKKRTGGEQQIINPVLNGMVNHIEVVKKSIKQIVYNKVAGIAIKGTAPELMQRIQLRSFKDDTGRIIFPQEKDENIIMARINYKRVPVLVDKLIKQTIDNTLTYQSMNIFEHFLVTSSRIFTIGTTGAFAPFSLVNFPADQWNGVLNTRNNYTPLLDQIKILGKVMTGKGGEIANYWQEWSIMGGDRMTLFQSQMQSSDEAVQYVAQEKNGLEKVIGLIDKGIDIASIPSKYSETASRFSEYVKARKSGKHQVVALEEAGRVTTPFHHIGSWRFGDKASAKFMIRTVPFGNASLQVLAQAIRTAETSKGKKRLAFVLMASLAAYMSSMAMISLYGSQDQKEQYKDLRPNDLASFLHFPALSGNGIVRVRISQEFTTIGTVVSMIMAQQLFGAKYTADDYKQAFTEWLPRQINLFSPIEAFFSLINPAIKIPIEVFFNTKDYPKISPIENQSMQKLQPKDRKNEATSALAKQIGNTFNISPLKTDYLIQGLFGRATGYLVGKPRIYDPTAQVSREYYFTLGRRVENFYDNKTKADEEYASLKAKWKDNENIPQSVYDEAAKLKTRSAAYKEVADYLKEYRKIPDTEQTRLKAARQTIIPLLEKLPNVQ
jgi:hypothetical protein